MQLPGRKSPGSSCSQYCPKYLISIRQSRIPPHLKPQPWSIWSSHPTPHLLGCHVIVVVAVQLLLSMLEVSIGLESVNVNAETTPAASDLGHRRGSMVGAHRLHRTLLGRIYCGVMDGIYLLTSPLVASSMAVCPCGRNCQCDRKRNYFGR